MDTDNLYPEKELTGKIIGILFEVYNRLGFGYPEKIYQEAVSRELELNRLKFKRENIARISYKDKRIGYFFHDFLVEDRVILELKVGTSILSSNISQVLSYLKSSNLRIGLIAVFTKEKVIVKRVIS